MTNHPFHVGQRVVALKDHPDGCFKKGEFFIVTAISSTLCKCNSHDIQIGDLFGYGRGCYCGICCHRISTHGILWFSASRFAPINPREVEIDEAIIEQAKELISLEETVKQLETVNN